MMGKLPGFLLRALAPALVCGGAIAGEESLPDFETCMNSEVARYERALSALKARQVEKPLLDIAGVGGVEFCGTVGIVRCDRSEDRIGCQRDLAAVQDSLRSVVLQNLQAPSDPVEDRTGFADRLYRRVLALAHGRSAGPDCAGADTLHEVWCEARQANARLRLAVLAWQVARFLDRAAPAVAAGWAEAAAPIRPKARPEVQP